MKQKDKYPLNLKGNNSLIVMKKISSLEPGKLEEIVVVVFFVLFFILTAIAELSA
jgi:hypothetical protein